MFVHLLVRLSRIQQEVPSQAVLEQEMVWMKEHLSTLGSPVVLCHNDLLCKNIIHNSKEGEKQRQPPPGFQPPTSPRFWLRPKGVREELKLCLVASQAMSAS